MFWKILGITAGILILLFAAFAAVSYFIVFYTPKKRQNEDLALPVDVNCSRYGSRPRDMVRLAMSEPYERVETASFDGLALEGRLYQRSGPDAPLAICFHGYRGTPARDFSGGLFSLLELGCNVLLASHRGHCGSSGHTITFGIKERRDCVSWAEYAAKRFGSGTPVILVGISMGAATVLMASGDPGLPANVKLIFADCPFNSPEEIIRSVMRRKKLPDRLIYPAVYVGARVFGRFDPDEITAAESLSRAKVPVIIVHGEQDNYVPCAMSEPIAAANPLCRRYVFPDADHGMSYMEDQARYEKIMGEALETALVAGKS